MESPPPEYLVSLLHGEFFERAEVAYVPRLHVLAAVLGKINVYAGMRRTGKTTYLQSIAREKLAAGQDKKAMLWVSFEDDRLGVLDTNTIGMLVSTFYGLFPENHERVVSLFFDEVQVVPEWERPIRRLYDSKQVEIYLSGSSSALLSKEIGTALRGRSLLSEIWPYSFREFLSARGETLQRDAAPGSKQHDQQSGWFSDYTLMGGFPEVVRHEASTRSRILQEYRDVVILRDVIERYQVTNHVLLRYLVRATLFQPARSFTVHKFASDCKSQGIAASKNTIHEYLAYLEHCYLVFTVPLYAESIRKQQSNPRKVYAVDTGMALSGTSSIERNRGYLFENIVYLDLRRMGCAVSYYLTRSGYEVDFIAQHPDGTARIIQVCYDMSDTDTRIREQRALDEAMLELGLSGELVTPENYARFCP